MYQVFPLLSRESLGTRLVIHHNSILEMLVEKWRNDVVTMPTEAYLESEKFRGDTGYRPLVGMVKAREF